MPRTKDVLDVEGHAPQSTQAMSRQERMVRSSAVLGSFTLIARVFGFLREMLLARSLGTTPTASSLVVAQFVPTVSRSLVSEDVARGALVPVMAEDLEAKRDLEVWHLARVAALWASLILAALTVVVVLLAAPIVAALSPDRGPVYVARAADLLKLLAPMIIANGVVGASSAFLTAGRHFTSLGLAQLAVNLPVVVGLVLSPGLSASAIAVLITAGAFLQAAIQAGAAMLNRASTSGRVRLPLLRHPQIKEVGLLALPVVVTLGMANFSGLIDVAFASTVGAFGPAALDKAFRLIQLPYGVIAVAIGVVALAELARTSQQPHEFDHDLSSSVRLQLAILVPIAIVTAIAAEPIVRVIYERGAFNALSTEVTSHALVGFAPALPALGLSLIASRAWLSKKRPWIPAGVATAGLAMNALLDWILIGPFGIAGIGIATAIAHTAVGGVLLYSVAYDRRRVTAEVVGALGRLVLACALAAGAGFVVWVVARVAATQDVSTIAACAVFLVTLPAIGASLGLDDYRRAADALKARRKGDELVDGDVLG